MRSNLEALRDPKTYKNQWKNNIKKTPMVQSGLDLATISLLHLPLGSLVRSNDTERNVQRSSELKFHRQSASPHPPMVELKLAPELLPPEPSL